MDAKIAYRPIKASDNAALARLIRDIFEEFEVPETGTAFNDPSINDMKTAFGNPKAVYYVAYGNDRILGGAGIAPLPGEEKEVCELQKMYVHRDARHQGLGKQLLSLCLEAAKKLGYTQCYLETMSNMHQAQAMYLKNGFRYLEGRMGDTGHYACPVWMIKEL